MDTSFSPSGHTNEEQKTSEHLIDLRARGQRIDPQRLSTFTKLPEGSAVPPSLLEDEGSRLSRKIHLHEVSEPAPIVLEKKEAEENTIPSRAKDIGHIALSQTPNLKIQTPDSEKIPQEQEEQSFSVPEKTPVPEKTTAIAPAKKAKFPRRFALNWKEGIKFVATSAAIFFATLVIINFQAYYQMVEALVNPQRLAALGRELGNLTEPAVKTHRTPLLPIAGIERKVAQKVPAVYAVMPDQNRLIVPKLGKNIPIVAGVGMDALLAENWKQLEDSIQDGLRDGVVKYPGTADPGQKGNVFITGHSSYYFWDPGRYKDVFALLGKLEVGDEYIVLWKGNEYRYKILEKKTVRPEDTSVLDQPVDRELSTLMTCWPVGTTQSRLIYVAERIPENSI